MCELIRAIRLQPYADRTFALRLYDTHKSDSRGCSVLGYEFAEIRADGTEDVIFADPTGRERFAGSPMHADDSDATLCALLGFITLRPGDTDADYFAGYTDRQRDWTDDDACEALSCDVACWEDDRSQDAPWVELES